MRFKSEVIYSGKDSIGLLAHDKKKDGKPKISGEKMLRSKYILAQTTFRQKSDNLNYIYSENGVNSV